MNRDPSARPTSRPLLPATRDWWAYERDAVYDVVGTTVDVAVRDGITIACELRRPARDGVPVDGRFPGVVVEFTPYVVLGDFYRSEADFFAARGYNALTATLRGIGASGGRWGHGSFRQAGRDAHDLIEWFAAQPFSDGRIGMYGESFGAQTSYRRGGRTTGPSGGDRTHAVAVVAVPRRGVSGRDQVDRAR